MGFAYPAVSSNTIWTHCASVGEVNTYLPLHLKLVEKYPEKQFVITTNTTTGARTIQGHKIQRTNHCYLPVEWGFSIKRFLNAWTPEKCLVMETEIWPLLYQQCNKREIPVYIINARLSHRTLNANNWLRSIYKNALSKVETILCKSSTELDNFKTLGAVDSQLITTGNLKFSSIASPEKIQPITLDEKTFCVAASTHNNEEQQLAELWCKLETDRILTIVPRHPNRSQQIQKQLSQLKINYAVRSKNQPINKNTKIYLADTLGELNRFIAGADFVFIGGSLIPHGGQNILEPARLGKAIVCGPHMFNFVDELDLLLSQGGCLQVKNIEELENTFQNLLTDYELCQRIGKNALAAMDKQSNILDAYLKYL